MSDKICPVCQHAMMGVEYTEGPERFDGISEWACMNTRCGSRFGRWTGKRLADGEVEPRYGVAR